MKINKAVKNPILILGVMILLTQIAVSWLSGFFIFGVGHANRPIVPFIVLELVSFAFYFAALEWVRRLPKNAESNSRTIFWIFLIGILCRLAFLPSNLIQETDPYRYIWDGQTVLESSNPYQYSPKEAFENRRVPAANPTPTVTETFEKINHAGVKTIYPPLAQFLFAFSQWISPWHLTGWRLMILGAEAGILVTLIFILGRLKLAQEWLILYTWSPLVLKEFSNSLHLDAFAILFLCGVILGLVNRWTLLSYVSLALAALTKFFPVVLLPLLFAWAYRQDKKKSLIGLGAFFVVAGLFYIPFLNAWPVLFEGLGRFAGEWQVNESLFGIIRHALKSSGLEHFQAEFASRLVSGAVFLALLYAVVRWLGKKETVLDFFKGCGTLLASLFFLAPTGNPWYFTWVIPFLLFLPLRSLILFSGLVFFYYLDFYFAYQGRPQLFVWVKFFEYSVFYFFLGWELWSTSRNAHFPPQFAGRIRPLAETPAETKRAHSNSKISIILPVANERNVISNTLNHLLLLGADEIIAVDGFSSDGTDGIIRREFPSVRLFQTAYPERALQMNLGAFEATGDIFLFVHADMKLPIDTVSAIRSKIDAGYIGGGFKKRYAPSSGLLRLYEFGLNEFYLSWMRCLVGTNAIFVTSETFKRMNGFHDQPFLEDLIFAECLKQYGPVAVISDRVQVSSRRYFAVGIFRQILRNLAVMIRYKLFRQSPDELREIYEVNRNVA